jgi:hypothetical protein
LQSDSTCGTGNKQLEQGGYIISTKTERLNQEKFSVGTPKQELKSRSQHLPGPALITESERDAHVGSPARGLSSSNELFTTAEQIDSMQARDQTPANPGNIGHNVETKSSSTKYEENHKQPSLVTETSSTTAVSEHIGRSSRNVPTSSNQVNKLSQNETLSLPRESVATTWLFPSNFQLSRSLFMPSTFKLLERIFISSGESLGLVERPLTQGMERVHWSCVSRSYISLLAPLPPIVLTVRL